jgi:hypothetical protein
LNKTAGRVFHFIVFSWVKSAGVKSGGVNWVGQNPKSEIEKQNLELESGTGTEAANPGGSQGARVSSGGFRGGE